MQTIENNSKGIIGELREFTEFLINELTLFETDPNGFVVYPDGEQVTVKSGKKSYRIRTFTDVIEGDDIIVLNPANESISKSSADKTWLFEMMAVTLATVKIGTALKTIAHLEGDDASPAAVDLVSRYSADMPAKFFDEVLKIIKSGTSFFNVWVNKNGEAVLRSIVFEPQFNDVKASKATKTLLTKIIQDMFQTKDLSEYKVKPSNMKCPQLEATLLLYKMIYENLNKFLEKLDPDQMVDTIGIEKYIDRLEVYHDKSKWLVQSINKDTAVSTEILTTPQVKGAGMIPTTINHGPSIIPSSPSNMPRVKGASMMAFQQNVGYGAPMPMPMGAPMMGMGTIPTGIPTGYGIPTGVPTYGGTPMQYGVDPFANVRVKGH